MLKLYFGNSTAIISTILLGCNVACMIWGVLNHTTIKIWGAVILFFVLLHGMFWYFANIRDLYSNSIGLRNRSKRKRWIVLSWQRPIYPFLVSKCSNMGVRTHFYF